MILRRNRVRDLQGIYAAAQPWCKDRERRLVEAEYEVEMLKVTLSRKDKTILAQQDIIRRQVEEIHVLVSTLPYQPYGTMI